MSEQKETAMSRVMRLSDLDLQRSAMGLKIVSVYDHDLKNLEQSLAHERQQVKQLQADVADLEEGGKALSDAFHKQHEELVAERQQLGNLLAIIHRDGGHYTEEHGLDKSVEDAHQVWAELVQQKEAAEAALKVLRLETASTYWDGHDHGSHDLLKRAEAAEAERDRHIVANRKHQAEWETLFEESIEAGRKYNALESYAAKLLALAEEQRRALEAFQVLYVATPYERRNSPMGAGAANFRYAISKMDAAQSTDLDALVNAAKELGIEVLG